MTSSGTDTPSPTATASTLRTDTPTPPSTRATSPPCTPPAKPSDPESPPTVYSYSPPPSPTTLPRTTPKRAPIIIPDLLADWPTFTSYPPLVRAHWSTSGLRVPVSAEAHDDVVSLVAEIMSSDPPPPPALKAAALEFGRQVAVSRMADRALRRVHVHAPRDTGRLLIHEIIEEKKKKEEEGEREGIKEAHSLVVGGGTGSS
ncbi:uncharacterized protein LOC62_04G006030 [Vanrija pseudolonga]|uniref:Uncharacterized protein n=1 Tax=Vanrija pseudolonga TaxID=143232 RepID=A0AAF0YDL3_9TREE|nr:hypothetical protein LOC62_04G006030 [Vanrija pseudolonga]